MSELASFDTDGDGVDDKWTYDTNYDGVADQAEFDTTGDGYSDSVSFDVDYDGDVDQVDEYDASGTFLSSTVDLDDDGNADEVHTDLDGDGYVDQVDSYDAQGNLVSSTGDATTADSTAITDSATTDSATTDTATTDTATTTADPATAGEESYEYDNNGDGTTDQTDTYDAQGNWVGTETDTNFDGVLDEFSSDFNADGIVEWSTDTDGDGVVDETVADANSDGITDTYSYDLNADGVADAAYDPASGGVGDGGVHGGAEAEYFQAQAVPDSCAPTSAATVLTELGIPVTSAELVQAGLDQGFTAYEEDGTLNGMANEDLVTLMEQYGVDVELVHGSLGDLEQFLDEGKQIIVSVDELEITGEGDDVTSNHDLVVTGIDEQAGVVTLNDSGQWEGAGVQVPLDTFLDAWADSENEMIVTVDGGVGGGQIDSGVEGEVGGAMAPGSADVPAEQAQPAAEAAPEATSPAGFAILSMSLQAPQGA